MVPGIEGKDLSIKQITIGLAILIITTILLVAGVVAIIRTKAADKYTPTQAATESILFQAPMDAVLLYDKTVPLRSRPNLSGKKQDTLLLPSGQPYGHLKENEIGGVRINPDETTWIIVIRTKGNVLSEYYAPFNYFDISPTSGFPYLNRVQYHWPSSQKRPIQTMDLPQYHPLRDLE
jgi:hypothetical protein